VHTTPTTTIKTNRNPPAAATPALASIEKPPLVVESDEVDVSEGGAPVGSGFDTTYWKMEDRPVKFAEEGSEAIAAR
jgi:hypothetical protein